MARSKEDNGTFDVRRIDVRVSMATGRRETASDLSCAAAISCDKCRDSGGRLELNIMIRC